jgi:hypothetical protein
VSQFSKSSRYVEETNHDQGFRSCLLQDEAYVLACYRYIELNPVRACMVEHPAEYRWSSYRANAQGDVSVAVSRGVRSSSYFLP